MKKNSMRDWKKILKFIVITAAFAILILIAFYKVYNMSVISDKDFITYHQGLEYLEKKTMKMHILISAMFQKHQPYMKLLF